MIEPGHALPAHRQQTTDKCVYFLGGTLELTVGGETQQVGAGAFAFVPRNTSLKLVNCGDTPAHFVLWTTPGGQEPVYALLHERQQWSALTQVDRQLLEACDFLLGDLRAPLT